MPESIKSCASSRLSNLTLRSGSLNSLNTEWSLCNTFAEKYEHICKVYHTQTLREIKTHLSQNKISFIGDRIKYDDWIPLLKTIKADKHLHYIELRSRISSGNVQEDINTERKARDLAKGPVFFSKFLMFKIMESINGCLTHSRALKCLAFNLIPLQKDLILILCEALQRTKTLQHLSLRNCKIGDEDCKLLCRAIRNTSSLISIDLSGNEITEQGAFYVAELLKAQEIARYGECWKHSLRYRDVPTEIIPGLRRVSLNNNPDIGDKGLRDIVEILFDDYWIKALDIQNCGITDWGCNLILKLLNINNEISIIDVRRNPIVDTTVLGVIVNKLANNGTPEDRNMYGWLDIKSSSSSSGDSSSSISSLTLKSNNGFKSKPSFYAEKIANSSFDPLRNSCSTSAVTNRIQYKTNYIRNPIKRTNSSLGLTTFPRGRENGDFNEETKLITNQQPSSVNLVMGKFGKYHSGNIKDYSIKAKGLNKIPKEPVKVMSQCVVPQRSHCPSSKPKAVGAVSESQISKRNVQQKSQLKHCGASKTSVRPWSAESCIRPKLINVPEIKRLTTDDKKQQIKRLTVEPRNPAVMKKESLKIKPQIKGANSNQSLKNNKTGKVKQQKKGKKIIHKERAGSGSSKENHNSNIISKKPVKPCKKHAKSKQILTSTNSNEQSSVTKISLSDISDCDGDFNAQSKDRIAKLRQTFHQFIKSQEKLTSGFISTPCSQESEFDIFNRYMAPSEGFHQL